MQKVNEEVATLKEMLAQSIKTKMQGALKVGLSKANSVSINGKKDDLKVSTDVKKTTATPVRARPAPSKLGVPVATKVNSAIRKPSPQMTKSNSKSTLAPPKTTGGFGLKRPSTAVPAKKEDLAKKAPAPSPAKTGMKAPSTIKPTAAPSRT